MLDVNENLQFLAIGHRGCAGVAPENTLLGIRQAIDMGCKMVEVDVHLRCGEKSISNKLSLTSDVEFFPTENH